MLSAQYHILMHTELFKGVLTVFDMHIIIQLNGFNVLACITCVHGLRL